MTSRGSPSAIRLMIAAVLFVVVAVVLPRHSASPPTPHSQVTLAATIISPPAVADLHVTFDAREVTSMRTAVIQSVSQSPFYVASPACTDFPTSPRLGSPLSSNATYVRLCRLSTNAGYDAAT